MQLNVIHLGEFHYPACHFIAVFIFAQVVAQPAYTLLVYYMFLSEFYANRITKQA